MLKIDLTLYKEFAMSHNTKMFIGFLSFLPIILLVIIFAMFLTTFPSFFEWEKHDPTPQEMFSVFAPMFILGMVMGLLSLGLLVFFIMHLVRNKSMEGTERVIWILVFLFAGIVGYPIYWYMRVWNESL